MLDAKAMEFFPSSKTADKRFRYATKLIGRTVPYLVPVSSAPHFRPVSEGLGLLQTPPCSYIYKRKKPLLQNRMLTPVHAFLGC